MRRSTDVVIMLGHSHRRWPNIRTYIRSTTEKYHCKIGSCYLPTTYLFTISVILAIYSQLWCDGYGLPLLYSILFYSILFYSILFYSILFYSILFYSILFYSILFYSILFYSILFYSILTYSAHCILKNRRTVSLGANSPFYHYRYLQHLHYCFAE